MPNPKINKDVTLKELNTFISKRATVIPVVLNVSVFVPSNMVIITPLTHLSLYQITLWLFPLSGIGILFSTCVMGINRYGLPEAYNKLGFKINAISYLAYSVEFSTVSINQLVLKYILLQSELMHYPIVTNTLANVISTSTDKKLWKRGN